MRQGQALGMVFVAIGVMLFFLTRLVWSRVRKDPLWLLQGELRELLSPGTALVANALLLVLGMLLGCGAVGVGLILLRWF